MIRYAMHQKKFSGFMPSSCDHPPIVTISSNPTETSRISVTSAFIILLDAFSRFGNTTV
jgi:hypothetical protein